MIDLKILLNDSIKNKGVIILHELKTDRITSPNDGKSVNTFKRMSN